MTITTLLYLLIIGLLAGLLGGLVGVGGGIVMVPLFVYLLGFSQHQAQGMSLAVMLPPVTLLAVLNYHKNHVLDWKMVIIVSLLFLVGGYFGSKISLAIDQKVLKKIFGAFMLIVSIKLILTK